MYFNPRAPYGARRGCFRFKDLRCKISIHAPHTGRDRTEDNTWQALPLFQSTRPIRGATNCDESQRLTLLFQSTRPIRGATTPLPVTRGWSRFQSTRPIRGATQNERHGPQQREFQSTRPIRGATICIIDSRLRARNFNPRAPYGARL